MQITNVSLHLQLIIYYYAVNYAQYKEKYFHKNMVNESNITWNRNIKGIIKLFLYQFFILKSESKNIVCDLKKNLQWWICIYSWFY